MCDDITYLIENSEKNSQIIYIDSSLRNKYFYPESNNYTIIFDQPFKLVYGFEVLDSSIPVTMYNIDVYNNTLYYSIIQINPLITTPSSDPIFYLNEIITSSSFEKLYNNLKYSTFAIIGTYAQLSQYINLINSNNEDPTYNMYIRNTLITSEIIYQTNQITNEFLFFTFKNINFAIKKTDSNQHIIDILNKNEYNLDYSNIQNVIITYYDVYTINNSIYNSIKVFKNYILDIQNLIGTVKIGNYTILSIINALNNIINPTIDASSTTTEPNLETKMYFYSSSYIMINASASSVIQSLGFDTYPALSSFNNINFVSYTIGKNYLIFGGIYDPNITAYKIVSPGLISLLGERFAILRIPEIEDNLYGSYGYMGFTPGIGMFKMTSTFGTITNNKFDYTTLITKPFHPIGKLTQLSISFKTLKGFLYDFKGVNHQLLIAIKYYIPTPKLKYIRSILNPNYDPDIMRYMSNNKSIACKEDSDDEQEFDDDTYYQTYKKELDKYNRDNTHEEKNTAGDDDIGDEENTDNNTGDDTCDDTDEEEELQKYFEKKNLI